MKINYKFHVTKNGVIKKNPYNRIPSGLSQYKQPKDFDQAQLRAGMKVEMEHTSDSRIAKEIAMDHLTEDKEYYIKLKKVNL
jgi:hypothetical protein